MSLRAPQMVLCSCRPQFSAHTSLSWPSVPHTSHIRFPGARSFQSWYLCRDFPHMLTPDFPWRLASGSSWEEGLVWFSTGLSFLVGCVAFEEDPDPYDSLSSPRGPCRHLPNGFLCLRSPSIRSVNQCLKHLLYI